MTYLFAASATVGMFWAGMGLADPQIWIDAKTLNRHLHTSDRVEMPAAALLPDAHFLCAAGSYAASLPHGYDAAARELERSGLFPVSEGSGIIVALDAKRRVQHSDILSVWPAKLVLNVAEPVCIPAAVARLDLRRKGQSITVGLTAAAGTPLSPD